MSGATTDAERIVSEYCRCWNERTFAELPDVVGESFTLTSPTADTLEGREAVESHLRDVFEGFPDYHIELHDVHAGDDVIFAESTHSGTHEGEFNGIPGTGESFEVPVLVKFDVADGKLRTERAFFDLYDVLAQLGLVDV